MTSDKFLDISMQCIGIAQPSVVVADGILDILCIRNVLCKLTIECDRDLSIGSVMQHKGWNPYRGQDRGDIDLTVNVQDSSQCSGTARQSLVFRELSDRFRIAHLARGGTTYRLAGAPVLHRLLDVTLPYVVGHSVGRGRKPAK